MTTVTRPPGATGAGNELAVAPLRRRRPSRLLWLGVALVVVGALVGLLVYSQAGQRVPVVALARPVPFGHAIVEGDLAPVSLPADSGLATMGWSERGSVVNRPAATDLRVGQVVTPDSVLAGRLPGAGQAIVGVAVKRGQLPATSLAPQDAVLVVPAAGPGGAGGAAAGQPASPIPGSVLRVGDLDSSGTRVVDLLVAADQAPAVARLAGAGQAVLVIVPRR